MPFQITTWNVNGLRSVLAKGALNWVHTAAPDIVCLQEIKTRPDQLKGESPFDLSGYSACWHPAERPGYSGVATFCRQHPEQIRYGLGIERFDREGRVICTQQAGFLLFNVYFPSGQRDYGRVLFKLDFYAHLLELCDTLHAAGEQLVICGDFNTAHQEIDLRNPRSNTKTSGFLPEERAWVDRYLEHGLVDAYRKLYPQRQQFTWWTYVSNARQRNVGWRLDYFLVSAGLMPRVQDVIIHNELEGSDHCPVTLKLDKP